MDSPKNSDNSCGWSQNPNSFEGISSGLDQNATSPVTPKSERLPVAFNNGSPDVSESSYSELDSEAEAFYSSLNYHLVSPGTMDDTKQLTYGDLMKRFLQCEEELKTTSFKLQESEQEIEKLKCETEKRDYDVLLETARREIETRDLDIETEKRRVLELQTQIVDLETKLSDSSFKIENLVTQLDAETSMLREQLCDCQKSFSTEKTKLQTDLLEKQTFFEARVREFESRIEVLEDQIRHSDAAELEMQRKEAEINALKTDLDSRVEHIEALNKEKDGYSAGFDNRGEQIKALNKEFDEHKLRCDMLMTEKDGVCAELDNLKAEMRSRDIQIKQLVSESGNTCEEELRAMVKELERQVELQRNTIAEGKEEKREAIRQLCFTVDHYKSGYRQLLQLLSSSNKP